MSRAHRQLLAQIVSTYKKAGCPRAWAWQPDTPEERQIAEELCDLGLLRHFTAATFQPTPEGLAAC